MSFWKNPLTILGIFLMLLTTAVVFPEITLKWIVVEEETDETMLEFFRYGIISIALGVLFWGVVENE